METLVGGLIVAAGFGALLAFHWWLGKRIRRAGIGGARRVTRRPVPPPHRMTAAGSDERGP